jgi:hypothetical protein
MLHPGVRRVLFTHDLDAVVAEQEAEAWGRPAPSYTLADEVARLKAFDLVTVLGRDDLLRVKALAPLLNVIEAPPVFETRPSTRAASTTNTLLWLSSLSTFHRAAFEWFWQHVWARIVEAHPETRLLVVGEIGHVARELGAARDPRVTLAGAVEDVHAIYDRVDLALAPYYYGDGVKVKVLEALAHGVPVVTTSRGLSNTRLMPGRDVLVADDAAGFACHVVNLLASPSRRKALGEAGLAYVQREHDATTCLAGLKEAAVALNSRVTISSSDAGADIERGLRLLLPWVIDRCSAAGFRRVAVYGAGSHTRLLLRLWSEGGGPRVVSILTSAPGAIANVDGIPIVHAGAFDPRGIDAIVLSSREFEREMAEACASRWPDLPALLVWQPASHRPAPAADTPTTGHRWSETIPVRTPVEAVCS